MHARRATSRGILGLTAAIAVLLAIPVALPFARAENPASSTAASPSLQWAYGANRTVNSSGTTLNGTYEANAFFGYDVIFTQTNTSSTSYLLELQRTMASNVSVTYCQPDCTSPTSSATLILRATETALGFTNVTTQANVTVNGTAVAALGVIDSTARLRSTLDDSFSITYKGLLGALHTVSGDLRVNESAHVSVAFTPPLGFLPAAPSPGEVWNSTSHYVAVGGWQANFSHSRLLLNGTTLSGSSTYAQNASGNGSVGLRGADFGPITLKNGARVGTIALALAGPFHLREGLVFLPGDSDLFSEGAPPPWAASSFGGQDAELAQVDLAPSSGAHLGLLASSTSFSTSSVSPDQGSGLTPAASGNPGGTPPVLVQGQPEPVATAQQNSQCLSIWTCTPTSIASSSAPGRFGGLLVAAVVVGAVVLVASVVVVRRRPVASPPSPTSSLYPPGAARAPSPQGAWSASGTPRSPKGPVPDDPLDHLW